MEKDTRTWVWWSDDQSRKSGLVSILAISECVVCVYVYWWLWLNWGVTWHLWLIVLVTPLVLMQSDASRFSAGKWSATLDKDIDVERETSTAWRLFIAGIICVLAFLVVVSAVGFLTQNGKMLGPVSITSVILLVYVFCLAITVSVEGLHFDFLLWGAWGAGIGILLGLLVCILGFSQMEFDLFMTVTVAVVLLIGWIPSILIGTAIGFAMRGFFLVAFSTIFHPVLGLRSISKNWIKLTNSTDMFDPPKLLLGMNGMTSKDLITIFEKIWRKNTELKGRIQTVAILMPMFLFF